MIIRETGDITPIVATAPAVSATPTTILAPVVDTSTLSMEMSNEDIRVEFVEVWLKYDVPIMPYVDLIGTVNIFNFVERVNLITALTNKRNELVVQSNGSLNKTELKRVIEILKDVSELQETYEEDIEFLPERIKETIETLGIGAKISVGIISVIGVLLLILVGFYFFKSYATEKGKVKANKT